MGFEKFTKTGGRFRPKVSIWSRGQIGFNQGAIRFMGLERISHIVFYYDADTKRVGFELTNEEGAEGANKVKVRQTGAAVGAKSFLDYYQIDYHKSESYDVTYDKDTNLYIIDLTAGNDEDVDDATDTDEG